jgi:hypothetical protein
MDPATMSMDSESGASAARPTEGKRFLPRFPTGWVSESAEAEAIFARSLWLLVPLQYCVFTIIPRGLARDDVMATVAISLLCVVAIFLLSCLIALFVSAVRPLDPDSGDVFSRRVRMWVVGLMVCTTVGYLLLAVALGIGYGFAYLCECNVYDDPVTGGFKWLITTAWPDILDTVRPVLPLLSKLVYAFAAVLLILFAYRKLRSNAERIATTQEPSVIMIGVTVAAIMLVADFAATYVR